MADQERQDRVAALQRRRVERSPSPGPDVGSVETGPSAKGTRSVRRHAAPVGRVIAAGFSVAATLALLAGMALGDRVAADHSSTTVSTGEDGATEQAAGAPPAAAPPTPEEIVRVVRRKIYVEVPVDGAGVSSLRGSGSQGLAASPSRSARPSTSPAGVAAPAVPPAPAPAPRPAPVTKSRAS